MAKKSEPKAEKPKEFRGKIVDVDCIISTTESGNGLLLSWEGDMYITNVQFLKELMEGKLTKQDGSKSKGVNLGLLSNEDGENKISKTGLYLNLKDKSFYFTPSKDRLFVVPVSTVQKILDGIVNQTHMGEFVDN